MAARPNPEWPVLTTYDQEHIGCIALPLGGIGTGTVSLGGRGDLRDWEVANRPAKGFQPDNTFFALYAKPAGGQAVVRALEGALQPPYEGSHGCTAPNHGLPRFRSCSFAAAYPFGQVMLSDAAVPLDVRIEAFNPLVPADADASGIPIAVVRFVLTNKTRRSVRAAVCGSVQNFIGTGSKPTSPPLRRINQPKDGSGLTGFLLRADGLDPNAEEFGTLALATTARRGVSRSTSRPGNPIWRTPLLHLWDDFSDDGALENPDPEGEAPIASLAAGMTIPPRGSRAVTFLLTWHFPNRRTWTPAGEESSCSCNSDCIGNYYTTRYADAWDAAVQTAPRLRKLEADSLAFVNAFLSSDLPPAVKEAALYNLSTLRSQTVFRTPDGRMYGWEGCCDQQGCCHGSCTHVWNYEQATAFLFGSLSRGMREVEFAHATDSRGVMSFRVGLPLDRAQAFGKAAADGQMGCLMKLYRDWQLSGNDEFLRSLWPAARRALEFCWIRGGWDADRDGVMEGCQHNTMDVEYYGPNPQMQLWYLGALRAAEEMARHLGEEEFAQTCRELFDRGSAWTDANLFNGEYYEHHIQPPDGPVDDALRLSMGAADPADPDFQLGPGCLVDQLVGQFLAHICGLGYLVSPANVRTTLRSILKYNFRKDLYGHFNNMRTFALNDESALLMASYPRGDRPARPFPYFNEVMTGFEYTAAVGMLFENQVANGLRCIEAIRARYDGRRRNPFNEAECGHHYARAMASWAAVIALTGFHYSGVTATLTFAGAERHTRMFWSTGDAWGTCEQRPTRSGTAVRLTVLHGTLRLKHLVLTGRGTLSLDRAVTIRSGQTREYKMKQEAAAKRV